MAKQREKSEVEHLRAENRKMKAELRNLKKQVNRTNKRAHQFEDLEERLAEQTLEEKSSDYIVVDNTACPKCSKGKIETIDLGIRKLVRCDNCEYKETWKV